MFPRMNDSRPPADESARTAIAQEIESVDQAVLALVVQRLRLAEGLAVPSANGPPLRPGSEIKVLRNLLKNTGGAEPELVIELWRSLSAASTRRERVVDVVVGGARNDPSRLFDIARRHFGARTRIAHVGEPQQALTRVLENPASCVAVLPWPAAPNVGSWWPALSESRFHKLNLIAGLPIAGPIAETPEACVFSASAPEPAGDDVTLVMFDDPHHRAQRALSDAGLSGKEVARSEPRALVRIEGFVAADDPRVKAMGGSVERVRVLGSYARV